MSLIYQETDAASLCAPAAFCSPNGLGTNPAAGRVCTLGAMGTREVTATLAASEQAKIYAMLEIAPTGDTRNWFAANLTLTFAISTYNPFIDWVRTDVCHTSAACASLETLGTDTTPVNIGPDDPSFRVKTVRLAAAAVPVALGDKLVVLLSFTNTTTSPQSFGWVPQGTVTFDDWLPDRGFEAILGRKRSKKRRPVTDDDDALLIALDAEPWE